MSSQQFPQFRNLTLAEMRAVEMAAHRARAAEIHRLLESLVSALKALLPSAHRSRKVVRHA